MAAALPKMRYVPTKNAPLPPRKVNRNASETEAYGVDNPRLAPVFGAMSSRSHSGLYITEDAALNYSAFYAGVSLIARSMACIPKNIYRERKQIEAPEETPPAKAAKTKDPSQEGVSISIKELMKTHPSFRAINRTPNGWTPADVWWECMMTHTIVSGNGYSEIVRNGRGQAMEFHLLDPSRVSIQLEEYTGRPIYHVSGKPGDPHPQKLDHTQILHFRNPGWDGVLGKGVVTRARETLGLGLSAERYGNTFFSNGGRPAGFLKKPNRITQKERATLQQEWLEAHGGAANALQVGILSGGTEWVDVGMTNNDAQFLSTRKFQVVEICRWLNIPPHMLGEMEGAKYSNPEQMMLEFIAFTLQPWCTRITKELDLKLFTKDESYSYFTEADVKVLKHSDIESQTNAFEKLLRNGILTPNEWREHLNMTPFAPKIGSVPLIMASQMTRLEDVTSGKTLLLKQPKPGEEGDGKEGDDGSTPKKKPAKKTPAKKD